MGNQEMAIEVSVKFCPLVLSHWISLRGSYSVHVFYKVILQLGSLKLCIILSYVKQKLTIK